MAKGKKSKKHKKSEYTDVKCMCGRVMVSKEQLSNLDARVEAGTMTLKQMTDAIDEILKDSSKHHD